MGPTDITFHGKFWSIPANRICTVKSCDLCHKELKYYTICVPNELPMNLFVMLLHSKTWRLGKKTIDICEDCKNFMCENFHDVKFNEVIKEFTKELSEAIVKDAEKMTDEMLGKLLDN